MFKSRMHSVAMLLAVALTASVSVSTATASPSAEPVKATQPTTATPTFNLDSPKTDESSMEMTDSFICPPEETTDSADTEYTPPKPRCR